MPETGTVGVINVAVAGCKIERSTKLQFGNLPDYDWMVRCHHVA